MKQKIKVWNRDVFRRLEVNKNLPLQQVEIRGEEWIVNAFQQLLSEEPNWRVDIEGLHLQCLNFRETEVLELPFIKEEIHSALMEMNGNKAPSPDGFTVTFWQARWEFVNEEIVDLFKEFYDQRSFAKSLNTIFLVLIPKKGGAEDLGDF
ncbi:hypothetical protein CK203_038059 [Vitis vinifera]|uniref:Uncharacterized protein n=1 Tax=Vitis vinifera TaxID=29760 RepID=A0A438HA07_VITVI|nr:hypothetical protein CK203_038059 [Vitis vinifera]